MKCRRCKEQEVPPRKGPGCMAAVCRRWNPFQLCEDCRKETKNGQLR